MNSPNKVNNDERDVYNKYMRTVKHALITSTYIFYTYCRCLPHRLYIFSNERNYVFDTNSDFLIPIFLQPNVVALRI